MKMSAFPLSVGGFPSLAQAQAQLLMSAGGALNLPTSPLGSSPKDLHNGNPAVSLAASMTGGRVPALPDLTLPGPPAPGGLLPPHMAAAGMIDPRMLYSALNGGFEMKENNDALMAWRQIAAQAQAVSAAGVLPYDPHAAAMAAASFPYQAYPGMDLNGARRKNATRETTSTLKAWLYEHRKNPYPTKGEKIMLAIITKMTLTQVSTWFANARRRLKKENKMTWSPRNRTDDGSSLDGEDKEEDGTADDDNISIDLSDFESESSPQKQSSSAVQPQSASSGTLPSPNQTNAHPISPTSVTASPATAQVSPKDTSKPRIWSLADVAASKPSAAPMSGGGPIHHQSSSVRHRPYPLPSVSNTSSFRPWFPPVGTPAHDSFAYRQLASQSAAFCNPLMPTGLPTTVVPALRIPMISTPATSIGQITTLTPSSQLSHTSTLSTSALSSDKTIREEASSNSSQLHSSSSKQES